MFPCNSTIMAGFVRSLFGVGQSRDSGESERLQDLVDQDYDPFHHICGKSVVFNTKRRLIATRRTSYTDGIVFSAKPIPIGTMFQVKLLEKEYTWSGSLVSACSE